MVFYFTQESFVFHGFIYKPFGITYILIQLLILPIAKDLLTYHTYLVIYTKNKYIYRIYIIEIYKRK